MDISITPAVYVKLGAITAINMSNVDQPRNSPLTLATTHRNDLKDKVCLKWLTNQKPSLPAEPT